MREGGVGLPEALERAASELAGDADAIRPANGDPTRLLELLEPAGRARVLGWLLSNEADAAEELVEAWCDEDGDGAEAVLSISETSLPKSAGKLLRRARHRLRSRGRQVTTEPPAPVVAKLRPVEDSLREALVSAIDPRGTRAMYLVERNPTGGARLFELMLDEERGLLEFHVYQAGRSRVRRFLREFTQRDRFRAVPVDPDSARALVRRIVATQPADRPLPRGFSEWRSQMTAAGDDVPTPGESVRRILVEEAADGALDRVSVALREHEIGPWPVDAAALQALAEKIGEIAESKIIVSQVRRREQADAMMGEALGDLFAKPVGDITASRFDESAYVFWKEGRDDKARDCLAAGTAFRESAATDNPIARTLLEIWLGPVLEKITEDEKQEEGESLLIKPGSP